MAKTHTGVEDLAAKRALLRRYRECWEHELDQVTLSAEQRRDITAHVQTLREIDEDLLRLDRALEPEQRGRDGNDRLRASVLTYLRALDPGTEVPITALCEQFDVSADALRNALRVLRRTGEVALGPGGVTAPALSTTTAAGSAAIRRLS
jgi:hypothetical protein